MQSKEIKPKEITRRKFLKGVPPAVGSLIFGSLAGCSTDINIPLGSFTGRDNKVDFSAHIGGKTYIEADAHPVLPDGTVDTSANDTSTAYDYPGDKGSTGVGANSDCVIEYTPDFHGIIPQVKDVHEKCFPPPHRPPKW